MFRRTHLRLGLWITAALLVLGGIISVAPHLTFAAPVTAHLKSSANSTQNAIQIENQNPGDPSWDDFSAPTAPDTLSGYASATSVNHGGTIGFYVTTTASTVTIDIYRTGWYGGVGARHMMTLGTFPGQHQAVPNPNPVTGMVACNWNQTASLNVPSSWVTGVYLAKLSDNVGDHSFIFFVVRDDGGHEAVEFQSSVTTAEAYNNWGGTSLYQNITNGAIFNGAHAVKDSFDRPFNPGDGNGSGQYLWYEYPFVRWAESQGFDLTYVTDVDTDQNTNPLTNHLAFLSVGHDEYWSMAMRNNVQNAINAGVNVAFFGGNEMYWQIRFENDAAGVADRVEVGYKDFAEDTTFPGPDPQWNVNNSIVTSTWADPVVNKPESAITGLAYGDQLATASAAYVVQNSSSWVYANTGFTDGSSVPGIIAYEYDRVATDGTSPPGLTVLSKSPVTGLNTGAGYTNSSIYTAASGAMVFNAGDIAWSYGLDNFGGRTTADPRIQQTTANIIYKFIGQTPPPPPPPPPPGTYFSDGFESGSFSAWAGVSATGTASVESSIVNSGTFAVQLANTAPGQVDTVRANLAVGAQTLTYTRFYFRVASPASSTVTLGQGHDANNNLMWSVSYDAGRKGIDAYVWNGARTRYDMYSNTNIVAPNAWYGLEVELNQSTSGAAQVWLNGGTVGSVSGDLSVSSGGGVSQVQVSDDGPATVYFDDVKVASTYNGPIGGGYPGPLAVVTPSSLSFGNQNIGTSSAAQPVTLANNGTAPLSVNGVSITGTNSTEFSQSNNCGSSVPVGQQCTINVTFSPAGGSTRSATLTITDSDPSGSQNVSLSGSGVYPPPPANGIYFSDGFESGNFANWSAPSGTGSATVQTSVVNSGTYAAQLTDGTNQFQSITETLIGGPETLTYTRLYFSIASPAPATTTIAQAHDQNGNSLWVVVYDAGRQGLDIYAWNGARTRYDMYSNTNVIVPNQWYGLEIEINQSTSGAAQVWLNGGTIGAASGDFSVSSGGGVYQVSMMNQVAGTIYFDDVITSNKYNGPVNGAYPGPAATLSASSLTYGNQNTGTTSAAQPVTLTNSGTAPLSLTSVAIGGTNPGDFAQTNNCPATLMVNATCTVNVTFAPTAAGARSATLTFTDNAPSVTQSVALSGTGVVPPPPPPPPNGVYFQDGFESGNLSAWNTPAGTGSATVESSIVHSGTYACALANASGQVETLSANLVGGPETLTYTSFAFNLDSTAAAGTSTIARANDVNGNPMWVIIYDAGRKGLDTYVWNGARTRYDLYSNTNLISPNTWYSVEIELNETTSGTANIWLNGTSIAAGNADLSVSAGGGVNTVYLWNEVTGTIYFDDAKVANVQ
jgi:hypothetical protein